MSATLCVFTARRSLLAARKIASLPDSPQISTGWKWKC